LQPFDAKWLEVWGGMVAPKIKVWEEARRTAEAQDRIKAKL
jgi:hypothetical protein